MRLKLLLLFCMALICYGCEKQRIKKHYTGDFEFVSINEDCSYPFCNYDTIFCNGTIECIDKDIILIKLNGEQFRATISYDGILALSEETDASTDPHRGHSLSGAFTNDNNLEFTYYEWYSFMGHTSTSVRAVTGIRK